MKLGRDKVVRGRKIQFFLDRPESDDRDLDAAGGESVGAKLVVENLDAVVELGNGVTGHGTGGVEKQEAGAAGFGVFGELGCRERDLLQFVGHQFSPRTRVRRRIAFLGSYSEDEQ